ncbi:MAG: amidohydrolase family protein [Pirellulaceae bacterium]
MKRRALLHSVAVIGASSLIAPDQTDASADESVPTDETDWAGSTAITDTNVHLFHWPCRRLPLDETARLVAKLQSLGVESAWAGSFEGLLHRDIKGVNQRLFDACSQHALLEPMGTINPRADGWQRDLKRCRNDFKMRGIRVYPNYHQFQLADDCFVSLLRAAAKMRLLVQIAVALEDVRTQHPLLQVPDVDLTALPEVASSIPDAQIQLLNHRLSSSQLKRFQSVKNIRFDTARVDQTDGVATLTKAVGSDRVLFGSHSPFLIPEAALIRVAEANLSEPDLVAVLSKNASRFAEARV